MQVRVGTSGYSYKEWLGRFYPDKLPGARCSASTPGASPPSRSTTPSTGCPRARCSSAGRPRRRESFTFVLKAPQRITHQKRLGDVGADLAYFLETAAALGPKLGPVLYQLPPYLKKDLRGCGASSSACPRIRPAAFEFRHESWFDDEVAASCASAGGALPGRHRRGRAEGGDLVPHRRLGLPPPAAGGLRRTRDLAAWAERIRAQPWERAFVFFKHEDEATGPALAGSIQCPPQGG